MEGRKERGGWKVVSSSHEGANLPFVCGNFAAFRPTPLAPPSPSRGKLNPAEGRGVVVSLNGGITGISLRLFF